MDIVIKGVSFMLKTIMTCPLTRYHVAGIFLLLLMHRNSEIEPTEYIKESYVKLRFAPTPTKLLNWPLRMALCFLLALPNVPDFPLGFIIGGQYVFPFIFMVEIMSCLLLGLHVTNYCSVYGSKCFYTNDDAVLEEFGDYRSVFINITLQLFLTLHIIYSMWLCKSVMHIIQRVIRKLYKWLMRHVVPKVIPMCRVIVLLFFFNLQDAVIPVLCAYVAFKIFLDHWLLPLMDSPFTFPNDTDDTNANDDGNSSDISDEFEDIHEPADASNTA